MSVTKHAAQGTRAWEAAIEARKARASYYFKDILVF